MYSRLIAMQLKHTGTCDPTVCILSTHICITLVLPTAVHWHACVYVYGIEILFAEFLWVVLPKHSHDESALARQYVMRHVCS